MPRRPGRGVLPLSFRGVLFCHPKEPPSVIPRRSLLSSRPREREERASKRRDLALDAKSRVEHGKRVCNRSACAQDFSTRSVAAAPSLGRNDSRRGRMKGKKTARERQKNGAWAARESLPEITRNAFQENFSTVQAIRLVKKSKRVRMFPYSARREHFLLPRHKNR